MAMIYAFAALCLFGGALAQVASFGPCPRVETVADFDVARYLGRWYEAERYFTISEVGTKCVTADYSCGEDNIISMVNTRVSKISGRKSTVNGTARIPNSNEPGKLKVKYLPSMRLERDYWVLGTNYETYAVVYSCKKLLLTHWINVWILTRDQDPSNSIISEAYEVVKKNNLNTSILTVTEQKECEENPFAKDDLNETPII